MTRPISTAFATLLALTPLAGAQNQPVDPPEQIMPVQPAGDEQAEPAEPRPPKPRTFCEPGTLGALDVFGAGDTPVVLVPSLGMSSAMYKSFMQRNARRYKMYAVTLPGFGQSDPPPIPEGATYDQAPYAENAITAIINMMDEQGLDDAVFIGHQFGGFVALKLALAHPERVRSIIGIDAMPVLPLGDGTMSPADRAGVLAEQIKPQWDSLQLIQWRHAQRSGARAMVKNENDGVRIADEFCMADRQTVAQYQLEYWASDLSAPFAELKMPIALFAAVAEIDMKYEPRKAMRGMWRQAAEAFPNMQVVFFEETRKFITEDRPAELDRDIAAFLAGGEMKGIPLGGE